MTARPRPAPSWHDGEKWQKLTTGEGCPFCTGDGPQHVAAGLQASVVTVSPEVHVRGYCCVIPKEHAAELHDMSPEAAHVFLDDIRATAAVVQRLTGAIKLNYEIHGNVVPHVHLHIIPRYPGDAIEAGGTGFAQVVDAGYGAGEIAAWRVALGNALMAAPGRPRRDAVTGRGGGDA